MTENKKTPAQYAALMGGLLLIAAAVTVAVLSSLNNSWTEDRMFRVIVAWLLSLFLLEFGRKGRWFARYTLPENLREPLLRIMVGAGSLWVLWSEIESSLLGRTWKWSTAVRAIGLCFASYCAIRWAITGKLPSESDKAS